MGPDRGLVVAANMNLNASAVVPVAVPAMNVPTMPVPTVNVRDRNRAVVLNEVAMRLVQVEVDAVEGSFHGGPGLQHVRVAPHMPGSAEFRLGVPHLGGGLLEVELQVTQAPIGFGRIAEVIDRLQQVLGLGGQVRVTGMNPGLAMEMIGGLVQSLDVIHQAMPVSEVIGLGRSGHRHHGCP